MQARRPGPVTADWPAPRPSSARPRAFQPREKLLERGPRKLTQEELLALALGGPRPDGAMRVATELLRRHGLKRLADRPLEGWRTDSGLSSAAAARLCAVFELGRRAYRGDGAADRPCVSRPRHAFHLVRRIGRARKEHLMGLYLDAQNGLLHRETLSVGSLNTTRTHPREILYPAVVHLALGFILAHNHPSGSLEPSREDLEFTRAVRQAGELMGIELYDHLIVGRDGYTSLRERGLL